MIRQKCQIINRSKERFFLWLKAQQAGYIPDQQTMKEYDLCTLEMRIVNGQDKHTFEC